MGEFTPVRAHGYGFRATALAAALGLLAWFAAAPAEGRPKVQTLRDLVAQARKGGASGSMTAAPPERLARFGKAMAALASGDTVAARAGLAECGFEEVPVLTGRPVTLVRELPDVCAGGGVYALAGGPADRAARGGLALETPHSFFDRHTWEIGLALFEQGLGRAFLCNTVHRHRPALGGTAGATADVAHGESNFLHAATLGLAAVWPETVFVQLHGFENRRRSSSAGAVADFVLADGRRAGGTHALLQRAAAAFEEEFGRTAIAMHGRDTTELGATGNAQGRALNGRAADHFLHVEISATMRARLVSDAETLAKLRKALSGLCAN